MVEIQIIKLAKGKEFPTYRVKVPNYAVNPSRPGPILRDFDYEADAREYALYLGETIMADVIDWDGRLLQKAKIK